MATLESDAGPIGVIRIDKPYGPPWKEIGMDLGPVLGPVRDIGDFIREQRQAAQLSLRGLAAKAGVSNPYLSQVERGLRKPSADILAQIAQGLSISAETLLAKAGVLPERPEAEAGDNQGVVAAITADPTLTGRQKAALIEIYTAFRTQTEPADTATEGD